MSKKDNQDLITLMKNEILNQMKQDKEELNKKISDSNKEIANTIKEEIGEVRKEVKENRKDIEEISKRLDAIEKEKPRTLADIVKLPAKILPIRNQPKEHYIDSAKKIVGLVEHNPVIHGLVCHRAQV